MTDTLSRRDFVASVLAAAVAPQLVMPALLHPPAPPTAIAYSRFVEDMIIELCSTLDIPYEAVHESIAFREYEGEHYGLPVTMVEATNKPGMSPIPGGIARIMFPG